MNAKKELLDFIEDKKIKCVSIELEIDYAFKFRKKVNLKIGYTHEDFNDFLASLDFEYNAGFVEQELFGIIWFTDSTWADRHVYDGSEKWKMRKLPIIPKELYE